ncbi:MAG: hypothetical protein ACRDJU_11590 [Actinomycetota bacterium]
MFGSESEAPTDPAWRIPGGWGERARRVAEIVLALWLLAAVVVVLFVLFAGGFLGAFPGPAGQCGGG